MAMSYTAEYTMVCTEDGEVAVLAANLASNDHVSNIAVDPVARTVTFTLSGSES